MYFFEAGTSSKYQLFLRRTAFCGTSISWKQSHFLIVLHNQFYSIYTWKDRSFKYTMVWSDFEISQSFIVRNSKNILISIQDVLQMWLFKEVGNYCGIFKQASEKSTNESRSTWGSKCVSFEGPRSWEWNFRNYYIFIKALNGLNLLVLCSSKACKDMGYRFHRKCCEINRAVTFEQFVE